MILSVVSCGVGGVEVLVLFERVRSGFVALERRRMGWSLATEARRWRD